MVGGIELKMFIYKTTNLINNKIYIGMHTSNLKNYFGSGINIKKDLKKYGKENFAREIIEDNISTLELLREREKYWINFYNSKDDSIGYNIFDGGRGGGGHPQNEDARKKISDSEIGNKNYNFGREFSEETRRRLSVAMTGKNNPNFEKKHSEERKQKMSNSMVGKKRKNSSSQYVGVYYKKSLKKWGANIMLNGINYYLGYFEEEKDAALAWNKKAIELGVPPERLNIINEGKNSE